MLTTIINYQFTSLICLQHVVDTSSDTAGGFHEWPGVSTRRRVLLAYPIESIIIPLALEKKPSILGGGRTLCTTRTKLAGMRVA